MFVFPTVSRTICRLAEMVKPRRRRQTIKNPKLAWSPENPAMYSAVTTVTLGNKIVDTYTTPFGIRSIEFTATNGLLVNGRRVLIKGVCDHHDLGALGTAISERALERQIDLLQVMGCNAIRTSHNPPAPELLDLCDRKGMLVMDESFDAWRVPKVRNGYNVLFDDWSERDLTALLRRDRNHPSVILWSMGNEVYDQGKPAATVLAKILLVMPTTLIPPVQQRTVPTTSKAAIMVFKMAWMFLDIITSRESIQNFEPHIQRSRSLPVKPPPPTARAAITTSLAML